MEIRGILTTPYHPESNGTVERVNATLERILRKLEVDKPSDWNNHLQSVVFSYNISYHSSTKHTPFQLLYGRQPALPPLLYTLIQESNTLSYYNYLRQLCITLVNLQTEAYSNLLLQKTKAHNRATLSSHPLGSFLVGEQVMFYHNRGFGRINKLSTLWNGHIEIIEKTREFNYTLKDISTGQLINRVHAKYFTNTSLKQLKNKKKK